MFRPDLVRALLRHYVAKTGHVGAVQVVLKREAFEAICKRRKDPTYSQGRDYLAMTLHGRVPVVWINLERHATVRELEDTAAHEAWHIFNGPKVNCELRDGRKDPAFQRAIRKLIG